MEVCLKFMKRGNPEAWMFERCHQRRDLVEIFVCLSGSELQTVSSTCKEWRWIIMMSPELWRRVCMYKIKPHVVKNAWAKRRKNNPVDFNSLELLCTYWIEAAEWRDIYFCFLNLFIEARKTYVSVQTD